jgi:hypothetical protein
MQKGGTAIKGGVYDRSGFGSLQEEIKKWIADTTEANAGVHEFYCRPITDFIGGNDVAPFTQEASFREWFVLMDDIYSTRLRLLSTVDLTTGRYRDAFAYLQNLQGESTPGYYSKHYDKYTRIYDELYDLGKSLQEPEPPELDLLDYRAKLGEVKFPSVFYGAVGLPTVRNPNSNTYEWVLDVYGGDFSDPRYDIVVLNWETGHVSDEFRGSARVGDGFGVPYGFDPQAGVTCFLMGFECVDGGALGHGNPIWLEYAHCPTH